jgi:hypothetical protein
VYTDTHINTGLFSVPHGPGRKRTLNFGSFSPPVHLRSIAATDPPRRSWRPGWKWMGQTTTQRFEPRALSKIPTVHTRQVWSSTQLNLVSTLNLVQLVSLLN